MMIDLGRHAAFIWASYGVVAIALAAIILWLLADGWRQNRLLADFEARGIKRRSHGGGTGAGAAGRTNPNSSSE